MNPVTAIAGVAAFAISFIIGAITVPDINGIPDIFLASLNIIVAVMGGTTGGLLGCIIGNALRKLAIPDMVFGDGMMDLLKARLFWALGPQFAGAFIGALIGSIVPVAVLHVLSGFVRHMLAQGLMN